ncbi:iron ABC transporter permease [Actibacterium mucosum KCTC 23349]|uniref:Iron ABC transporter permease n=1 Tax=Actibacterium mucosum KCTC 23349 TaxID=1454373 RepID=A0A037ZH57_9RHOB|nr:lipocalin-like domain-containing protein [Actibacterium mucosum]KAJ54929.1 iron ABC transporter permease [Actibacterium mucosum KCTC 23349]
MNVKAILLPMVWLFWVVCAQAQSFAGLGSAADAGFATPVRGQALSFPTDHGAHPAYRIEWWYITANLQAEDGRDLGVQWTLFRSALAPEGGQGWSVPQVWMGHAAVTTARQHFTSERLARGGVGQAGAEAAPFRAWIDGWSMRGNPVTGPVTLKAEGRDFAYDLTLTANRPLVTHGEAGYSEKSDSGQASYYYSQPFYEVAGVVELPEGPINVTGQAWLDREWSSQPLDENQAGWDWVSLHFESGAKLMGFQVRDDQGAFTSGTWIHADGRVEPFRDAVVQLTPGKTVRVEGRRVPIEWQVTAPRFGLDVQITALNPQAWMPMLFSYWEGPVTIAGSHRGKGYLEMTGYD